MHILNSIDFPLPTKEKISTYICTYMWLDLRKLALMAQELKSNLQPDINDTLMRYLETSIVWLYVARFAFTDCFLLMV